MRRDFQIAILLALAAIPAGVALMAAPEYIGILKEYPGSFFWAGLILAALLIGSAIIIALRGEASEPRIGHTRRMIALTGMIVFGLGFLGSASVYFWPQRSTPPADASRITPKQMNKPWKHDLEDLFASDFNLLSMHRDLEIQSRTTPDDPNPVTIKFRFKICQDFNSGTDFVSIFIPVTNNIKIDEQILGVTQYLRDQIPKFYEDLKKSVGTGMGGRGVPYSEGKDLKFTGRVYIYTMQPFTPIQIGDLMKLYQDNGLSLQIRGMDYWDANKDR